MAIPSFRSSASHDELMRLPHLHRAIERNEAIVPCARGMRARSPSMRRSFLLAALAIAGGGGAREAHAQATAGQPKVETPAVAIAGEWRLDFRFESNSAQPADPPAAWITFDATVKQAGDTVTATLQSDGPTGQASCVFRDGLCRDGRMRLSWDEQDWQVFEFGLAPQSTTKGSGRAEIRFPDGERHRYSFVMTRAP